MDEWTEIRRKVLVEGASKRSVQRDYGIGHQVLAKILANPEPPGYQMAELRRKPVLGPHLATIDQILAEDKEAPPKQRHTARRIFERLRDEHGYLGIPTVSDRVVMAAAKIVLEPIFEADFLPTSFGFRPKRSAHMAVEAIRVEANRGADWVLDADVSDCFGSIDHDVLMALVAERVSDRWS